MIKDCKKYKTLLCWKREEGWIVESIDGIYNSFSKCKQAINNEIKNGNITIY